MKENLISGVWKLINYRVRWAFVIFVTLVGILINATYGIGLLKMFYNPQFNSEVREILISAIALEFGWAAMLLWVLFKPFERRHIVLAKGLARFWASPA